MIDGILKKQKAFFESGITLPVEYRLKSLKRLYDGIKKHEKEIIDALKKDLGKSETEGFMCEVGLALTEIRYMLKHTRKFARRKKVHTPLAQFCSASFKKAVPYGNVLIMSPWNYPFLLTIAPLADAIAAGNTVILKPSAYSPHTSKIIQKLITECYPEEYITAVVGGRKENSELLHKKFDFIFFTGSQSVGKEVLRNAAETLTPTVLELGGKSPCIVDATADIKISAKRIVFGKFLNCGQTCVAPDYILCEEAVKEELISEIINQIKKQYGEEPLENPDYGKIVNIKHFERILGLTDADKTVFGGAYNREKLQIEPTVMDNVNFTDDIMREEIFGPVLPVLTFQKFDDAFELLKDKPKPLAVYIFSKNKEHIKRVTEQIRFGGGCVNDTIIHLASNELGFGGVGESGMGAYHGKTGFEAFSHIKSIVNKRIWPDIPIRYQPYTKNHKKLLRLFLK